MFLFSIFFLILKPDICYLTDFSRGQGPGSGLSQMVLVQDLVYSLCCQLGLQFQNLMENEESAFKCTFFDRLSSLQAVGWSEGFGSSAAASIHHQPHPVHPLYGFSFLNALVTSIQYK